MISIMRSMLKRVRLSKEYLTIPTKENRAAGNDDSELPWLFRDNFVGWLFVSFYSLIIYFTVAIVELDFPLVNNYIGSNYIISNIEILVTTLAITMSVTLLGIQFRAQSYTMIALIKQMKDNIVYYFIIIFLVLITTNIIIIVGLSEFINIALPFMFTFTIFAMIYLVRYIFHMIHKLQPIQIIDEVVGDMEEYMRNTPKTSLERNEKFDVWEQIMLRAVETNNTTLFNKGLSGLFDRYNQAMVSSANITIRQHVESFFLLYAREIMLTCVRYDRELCASTFMKEFAENDKIILYINELKNYNDSMMLDVWSDMMELCILHKKNHLIKYGMLHFDDQIKKSITTNDTIWLRVFLHNRMSMLLNLSITNDNTEYQMQYLNIISKYGFPETPITSIPGTSLYMEPSSIVTSNKINIHALIGPTPITAWTIIMNNALKKNIISVYTQGINTMKKNLLMDGTIKKHKTMISALSELMKKVDTRDHMYIFLEYFTVLIFDAQIIKIWIDIIDQMIKRGHHMDVEKFLQQVIDQAQT